MVKAIMRGVETQRPPASASKDAAQPAGPQQEPWHWSAPARHSQGAFLIPLALVFLPPFDIQKEKQKSNTVTVVTFPGSMDQNIVHCAFMQTCWCTWGLPPTTVPSAISAQDYRCSIASLFSSWKWKVLTFHGCTSIGPMKENTGPFLWWIRKYKTIRRKGKKYPLEKTGGNILCLSLSNKVLILCFNSSWER